MRDETLTSGAPPLKDECRRRFEPAVDAVRRLIEQEGRKPLLIAIDGKCGSGKTTLGFYLKRRFDANLFHMDDFFLQDSQRTEERLAETGGNVDYERFREEVLKPLLDGAPVCYRPFDCAVRSFREEELIFPAAVNIVEGSYSMHPYFGEPYDLKIFVDIDDENQIYNIRRRSGEQKLELFRKLWIPKETAYFKKFRIRENSDLIIRGYEELHL